MTYQFFIMQAPSSRSPISKPESWNSWTSNCQPSRPWHGFDIFSLRFSLSSNCSSSDGLRMTSTLSFILQFRQNSSLFSLIRLPWPTSRGSPFSFLSTASQIRRNSLVSVSLAVGTAERFRSAMNSCQRSASDLLLFVRASSAAGHFISFSSSHIFFCFCRCAVSRLCALASVCNSHSLPGSV